MAAISQFLPVVAGGFFGGIFNSLGTVAKKLDYVGIPTFKEGALFGAMGGMASKIIYTRTNQYAGDVHGQNRLAINIGAVALMHLSFHASRRVANKYFDCHIPVRSVVILNVIGGLYSVPLVGFWTFGVDL